MWMFLVVDDIQLIDKGSFMVMQTFMESLRDASVVACIVYRQNRYVQERERHYAD